MEFFENRPQRPFFGLVQLWHWVKMGTAQDADNFEQS
jgi:hypothetical protein